MYDYELEQRQKLELDRKKAIYAVNLGNHLDKLKDDSHFKALMEYLDNQIKELGLSWAKSSSPTILFQMQGILSFKNLLIDIDNLAKSAKADIQSIDKALN